MFKRKRNPGLVVVIDNTDRLSPLWRAGTWVNRTRRDIRARSRADALEQLAAESLNDPITQVHWWGHGDDGEPRIAGQGLDLDFLAALQVVVPTIEAHWWRMCEVHKGAIGRAFALDVVRATGAASVGHTKIVAAPNPLEQAGYSAYTPELLHAGVFPGWRNNGLPSVSTLRMEIDWAKALAWRNL